MLYKIYNLLLGNNTLKKLFEINIQFNISQICHIDKFGFILLFKDHHFLGYVNYNGKLTIPWSGEINEPGDDHGSLPKFNYPSSICYCKGSDSCYIIDDGGIKIKSIEINSKYCNRIEIHGIDKLFSKINSKKDIITSCDINSSGDIYWVADRVNRCFKKGRNDNLAISYIGNGKSGFSVSNNFNHCSLSKPCGIRCYNRNIYISDSGNNCIREVKDNISTIISDISSPKQIKNIGNIFIFIDDEGLKYFSFNDKNMGILYKSKNIISFDLVNESKKEVYLLEKI